MNTINLGTFWYKLDHTADQIYHSAKGVEGVMQVSKLFQNRRTYTTDYCATMSLAYKTDIRIAGLVTSHIF